jgi:hypothetical protein
MELEIMTVTLKSAAWMSALVMACAALPAAATTLEQFAGRWNGAGTAALRGNPAEPFRCRIEIETQGATRAFFTGRCATAQGAQSFDYILEESADGSVRAQNRAQASSLPSRMSGSASPGQMTFSHSSGEMFELVLSGGTLRLRVQGDLNGHQARGEAFLTR